MRLGVVRRARLGTVGSCGEGLARGRDEDGALEQLELLGRLDRFGVGEQERGGAAGGSRGRSVRRE